MKNLLQSLDRPIAFQRSFVRLTGSITASLFLSQAIYWSLRSSSNDGWFWKTADGWENETGMTRREQDTARKLLLDRGLLREEKRGWPARTWFTVDEEKLGSCLAESANQKDCGKRAALVGGKRQAELAESANLYSESTSETTSTNTNPPTPLEKPRGGLRELDPCDVAAKRVAMACKFANPRLESVIARTIRAFIAHSADDADVIATVMIGNWEQYVRDGPRLRFVWSPRKFFADGHWANWKLWPLKDDGPSDAQFVHRE